MSWLRLDDKFAHHPKVAGLTDREFRVHIEAMLYCAEYATAGAIPSSALRLVKATPRVVQRLVDSGLWESNGSGLVVHHFSEYNPKDPSNAERQARWRRKRNDPVDMEVTDGVTGGVDGGVDPPAQARARGPSPSPEVEPLTPRERGTNPRAQGTNSRALGTNPRGPEQRAPRPDDVCADCGEKLGHGHADDCPRVPATEPEVAA